MVLDGAMNGVACLAYGEQALAPTLNPEDVAIMDNVPAHKARARALCEAAHDRFGIAMGRMHEKPVGPHPVWNCQLAVLFGSIIPWLALNRDGRTVFIHPETGDDLADRSDRTIWMGEILPLKLEISKRLPSRLGALPPRRSSLVGCGRTGLTRLSSSSVERISYAFHRHRQFRNVPIEPAPVGAEFLQERLDIGGRQPGLVGRATARSGDLLGKDGRQVRKPGLAKQLIGVLVVVTDGLRQTRTGPVRSSRMDADEHIRHEFSNGHMSLPVLILCGDLVRLPQNELLQGRKTLIVSELDLVLVRIVDPAHFTEISNDISIL